MKKTLLLILSILTINLQSFAQATFTTQNGDTAKQAWFTTNQTVKVEQNITNQTNNPLKVKWNITSSNFPSGWVFEGLCDNVTCYIGNVTNGDVYETDPYLPNTQGVFYTNFNGDAAANNTWAYVRAQIRDTINNYAKTVTFIAYKGALGISNVTRYDDEVVLYPNPARNNVNVLFDGNMGVRNIAIFNLIGKPVKIFKVQGNSAKLELAEIPSGIYFVRLINSQGKIVATRKLTRQ